MFVLKSERELVEDAIVFGGLQEPSDVMENSDGLGGAPENLEVPRLDVLIMLILFFDVESFALAAVGMPSHLEFTFGTVAGSF